MSLDYQKTIPWILTDLADLRILGKASQVVASVTQTQAGGTQLSAGMSNVFVVTNHFDAVTLPLAATGVNCVIHNTDTTQTLQVFPGVGDKIDAGATDASILIYAQQIVWLWSLDAITWHTYGRIIDGAGSYAASVTQTQAGGTPILTPVADVPNVGNNNDAVTLFPAFAGAKCFVKNSDTGQDLQIFPGVGDQIDGLAVNASIVLGVGSSVLFSASSNGKWLSHAEQISSKGTFAASATQTQGQGQLIEGFTRISVVGTDGDAVTLPLAGRGKECVLENADNLQYCQVFPASEDAIDGMTADLPLLLFPGQTVIFRGTDTTNWRTDWKQRAPSTRTGITATGNIISTATQLIADWNVIATSTATDNAVQLPLGYLGRKVWIHNDDNGDAVLVFPQVGSQIDDNATDASISLAVNATIELRAISTTKWRSNIT